MSWTDVPYDWSDAKLVPAISYPSTWVTDATNAAQERVMAMIESFNPRTSTPKDIIDSINNHNQGTVKKPKRFTFDVVTLPYGKAFELLQMCQLGDRYFDIILAPAENFEEAPITDDGDVGQPDNTWATELAVFKGAQVIDKAERYAVGTKPTITFSCIAMRYVFNKLSQQKKVEIGAGYIGAQQSDTKLGINSLDS